MGLTRDAGDFVSRLQYRDLPPEGVRVARLGFTDCVAVMVAGSREEVTGIVARVVLQGGEKPEASILLGTQRASAPQAAWVNGTAAHALDYDDANGHRSAILVPALLAEGEALGASGEELVTAYVAGFEVWSELARRQQGQLHEKGWHPTGIYGAIASAAACARLRRLDGERSATALALAASQACGLVANFGTMAKPFHAGNASRAGVVSARLAAGGMGAAADALEHPRGLLAAVSRRGDYDAHRAARLGEEWRIGIEGVSIKKFPTCYGTHRALDAMLALAAAHDLRPAQVAAIEVLIGRTQKAMLVSDAPRTGLEARFSIQFAMACALAERRVTLAELADATVQRADLQELMRRVHVRLLEEYDPVMPQYAPWDQVRVRTTGGKWLESERVTRARGHIARPVTEAELYAKFASCLEYAGSDLDARGLFAALQSVEAQPPGWIARAVAARGRVAAAHAA